MSSPHYLQEVLILLLAAVVFVPLFERLHLGSVPGYLAAGMFIGPSGFQLVADIEAVRTLADLGVVFLMFTIGLDLTIERLRSIGGPVYGLGTLVFAVTALAVAGGVRLAGYAGATSLVVGAAVAMSSTAIVLQVLAETAQTKTRIGRIALAILLLQDLAVGPCLVLVGVLGRPGTGGGLLELAWEMTLSATKAGVAILVIVVLGRLLLRPFLRLVAGARSPELFAAMTLLAVLGTGLATDRVGMSMPFGAFLAGLLLAETEYLHQVKADIEPFRGILLGLFFLTVGMTVDLGLAVSEASKVMALVAALMLVKALVMAGLGSLFRFTPLRALRIGILLSQGGEFAFVLLGMAVTNGVVPSTLAQLTIVVVAVSMAATPLLLIPGNRLLGHLELRRDLHSARLDAEAGELSGHVLIVGFGEVGRIVARMLKAYGVPYLILDA
ncbi:MAG: cation:proton antiporter, partial [Alphaproteobacteria bacterium]